MRSPWCEFWHEGELLCAYTVEGTFPGEMKATKELLAAEHGCSPEEITVKISGRLRRNETGRTP